MADVDTVLARLDEATAAFDEAQTKLIAATNETAELRTKLAEAGDQDVARRLSEVVSQLQAARQHAMGLHWSVKGHTATLRRELARQTTPPLDSDRRPAHDPREQAEPQSNMRVRSITAIGVVLFLAVDLVLDLLDKSWIDDRLYWAVLGVAAMIYAGALATGTHRQRRFVWAFLAGIGAALTIRGATAKATGWRSDDWRTLAIATAVLLAAFVAVRMVRRRRQ